MSLPENGSEKKRDVFCVECRYFESCIVPSPKPKREFFCTNKNHVVHCKDAIREWDDFGDAKDINRHNDCRWFEPAPIPNPSKKEHKSFLEWFFCIPAVLFACFVVFLFWLVHIYAN
jgi:hypothetical protein